MTYYYSMDVCKDGWWHTYGSKDYGKYFDEAVKVIDKLLPAGIAPSTMTELPALESGEIRTIVKDMGDVSVRFQVSEYKEPANEKSKESL